MSAIDANFSAVRRLGLGPDATKAVANLVTTARQGLAGEPIWAWWVPGRIEVLGKHTDYAGGQVLNCATDLGLVVVARPLHDPVVQIRSNNQSLTVPLTVTATGSGGMSTYVAAVARRLSRHFPGLSTGVDLSIAANLPAASGMSSSSALVIAIHLALTEANRLRERPDYQAGFAGNEELVPYLGCHENGAGFRQFVGEAGVGTSGGSQDHAAIVMSHSGQLNHWAFSPFHRLGTVVWPDELVLMVAVSGVLAEKTSAALSLFNRVADRVKAAVGAWNTASGNHDASIGAAILHTDPLKVLSAISDSDLRLRATQTVIETNEIVPGAVAALGRGDLATFGALTACSQAMAVTHLQNQIPETIALVASARSHGAVAASSFGAGFGGAVWAAFRRSNLLAADAWLADYRQRFPQHRASSMLHCISPGPGATALELA